MSRFTAVDAVPETLSVSEQNRECGDFCREAFNKALAAGSPSLR
jgi:hypothetical protein